MDGPEATVRKAWPVTVTPVGLLAMRCMGLWPSSAMVVAPELLERKWHWMGTRSTQTMIAICSPFRRHRKEAHEEKAEDHYHGSQARYFQTLCKQKSGTCRHRSTLEGKTMQQMVFCQFAMEVMVLMLMLRSSFVMKVMMLDIAMSFVRPGDGRSGRPQTSSRSWVATPQDRAQVLQRCAR